MFRRAVLRIVARPPSADIVRRIEIPARNPPRARVSPSKVIP
jgi:hypothetical protein